MIQISSHSFRRGILHLPVSGLCTILFLFILTLFTYPLSVWSQLGYTYPFTNCRVGSADSFAIGDTTYICININGKVTSIFNVVTDTFAAINIAASNYALPSGSGYIKAGEGWVETITANASLTSQFFSTFDISSMGVFSSYPRIYKYLTYSPSITGVATGDIMTIPVYTVIIQMDEGVVTNIGWDDGCFFCAENTDSCTATAFNVNTSLPIFDASLRGCRKDSTECYPDIFTNDQATNDTTTNSTLDSGNCDLKIFLTWTGTDKNGQFLRSANKRFSRYRAFGVATAYQAAVNVAEEGMQLANTALGEIKAVPGKILPGMSEERRLGSSFHSSSNKERTQEEIQTQDTTDRSSTNGVPQPSPPVMEEVKVLEHPTISQEDIEASYHDSPLSIHPVEWIPFQSVKITEHNDVEYDYYDDGPLRDFSLPSEEAV